MKKIVFISILAVLSLSAENNSTANSATAAKWQIERDPVYMLDISKYPKFGAQIVLKNGKTIPFVSVKSMMNFFYHPEKYPGYGVTAKGKEIEKMFVKDYLDGKKIPAESAWFVFGSRLAGPHGDDLIPLSSKMRAELFVKKFGGTKIMSYNEMRKKGFGLIKYLDM